MSFATGPLASAALFPVWACTDPDTPEMLTTMATVEKNWSQDGVLYWRRLECADSKQEGAFEEDL